MSIAGSSVQNKTPIIRVLEIRPIFPTEGEPPSTLKAFCKVQVGSFTFHACRIVQPPGQRAYAQLPMKEGGGSYYPVVSCDDPQLGPRIKAAILAAWQAYQEQEQDSEQLGLGLEVTE